MQIKLRSQDLDSQVKRKVEEISGENVSACYQCGKCSAGCPSAYAMDVIPSQVLRFLQIGLEDDLAASNTPWICASCEICSVRCPRGIEVARVMEALRHVKLRKRLDAVVVREVPAEILRESPPIAIVSAFRKMTS